MTSEPDNKTGRRPPTIELTATEVENAPSVEDPGATKPTEHAPEDFAADPQAANAQADRTSGGGRTGPPTGHVVSAVIGAIVMAAIFAALWVSGIVPSREAATATAPVPAAVSSNPAHSDDAITDVMARLDAIERTLQAQRPDPTLGTRLGAVEAQTKSLGNSLAALSQKLDDVAATSQSAAKSADAAQAAADAAKQADQAGVARSDLDALANRVGALESTVQTLGKNAAQPAPAADDRAARLTIAAQALRAAVERGVPFQAELAAVQSLGADDNAIAPLQPFAASGVPSAAALAHDLAALVPALRAATEPTPVNGGFVEKLEANAQKLVRITPVDAPVGTDPSTVATRIAIDASRADIAAALKDIAALPDQGQAITAAWVKDAQARDAAVAASRQIAAAALAALNKPATQ